MMNNTPRDWIWLQRDATAPIEGQAKEAYNLIIKKFIPIMRTNPGTPCEFIYCAISDTTNFTIERKNIDPAWMEIFKDAGFVEKPIPVKDWMESRDLKEALLAGSDFNKPWH
jgi:hypothetical protein